MKVTVVNCLSAGIRKNIDNPNCDQTIVRTVSAGEKVEIDQSITGYDWKDRLFYKCTSPVDGWIAAGLVET